ncbi:MAG: hypothetical protein GF390_03990 [Candidatus Pacebacteria bacterium]|nr:hypothetical protein [Candidatus Paceibacterota bacterium]
MLRRSIVRRREKFVIAASLLSFGFWEVQYVTLDWRYLAIAVFVAVTYLVSAWALADDLQLYEWLTIVPLPAMYAGAVSLFYFLLPANLISRLAILILFGIGMYALYLTANIYSVAKGRTIQLVYAAHAIGLFFTLLTSLLFTNSILSLRLPFYGNSLLISLVHFPLIFMSLWAVRLESKIDVNLWAYALLMTLIIAELAVLLSFLPLPVWHSALFIMSLLYVGLGVLHSFLRGRLFKNTLNEYSLVAIFMVILFVVLFPLK